MTAMRRTVFQNELPVVNLLNAVPTVNQWRQSMASINGVSYHACQNH